MISNPKYGWLEFELGEFKADCSYIEDTPLDLLDTFISYYEDNNNCKAAHCDEEGEEFDLFIEGDYVCIKSTRAKYPDILKMGMDVATLAKELIDDINRDIRGYAKEFSLDFYRPDFEDIINKRILLFERKIEYLEELIELKRLS